VPFSERDHRFVGVGGEYRRATAPATATVRFDNLAGICLAAKAAGAGPEHLFFFAI
jgi:hypothetical protein